MRYTAFLIAPANADDANDKPEVTLIGCECEYEAMAQVEAMAHNLADAGADIEPMGTFALARFPRYPNEIGRLGIIPSHELN